jgi:uncharacterized protein
MFKCIRDNTPCLPRWWVDFTLNYSLRLVVVAFLVTAGILAYTVTHFKINTDLNDMVSDKLPFRKIEIDYGDAFPQLSDTIVVVINADTPELASHARKLMAQSLMKEKSIFKTIYIPGGGSFFEKNGLLFLSIGELEALTDNLAQAQPFLALLSQDLSLKGLFSVLETFIRHSEEVMGDKKKLVLLFGRLSDALEHAMNSKPYRLSWQEIMTGEQVEKPQPHEFIVLQPFLDYRVLYPAKQAIHTIHRIAGELRLNDKNGVKLRITGSIALNHEDLISVQEGIGTAVIISLILVGVVLYIALYSGGLVFISLATLITGLIWTMSFAIAATGSLNLISITFVVLFIGLGIDYSIQVCLRYKELIESGIDHRNAIANAVNGVGNALLLCTITTAIGFYAFVPTAYAGASELGMISGTGMFINFFTNVTVLPALLHLLPMKKGKNRPLSISKRLLVLPDKYAGMIAAGAIILGLGATALLPKVYFDFNPLNLSNPSAESVVTAKELFKSGKTSPWTISILTGNLTRAKQLASELRGLKEVERAITIADFIPENQTEKLDIISDLALFMPPMPQDPHLSPRDCAHTIAALESFEKALKDSLAASPEPNDAYASALRRLHGTLKNFNAGVDDSPEGQRALTSLAKGLLVDLSLLLHNLETSLQARAFGESDLPKELKQRFVSRDGRYRIQVFPHENITDIDVLTHFTSMVSAIAPGATGAPVTILESGKAIVSAFKRALIFALIIITIFLLVVLRNRSEVVLILIPLVIAVLLTAATTVLLDIPFNFANIIVLPLLLGIGVDYSIHIVCRFRTEPSSKAGVLGTSTARAVLFSALTTIMSFSSLSILAHRGTASMGKLLTLCISFMILCVLIVLPAFLKLHKSWSEKR